MWFDIQDCSPCPICASSAKRDMNVLFPAPVTPMTAITTSSGLQPSQLLSPKSIDMVSGSTYESVGGLGTSALVSGVTRGMSPRFSPIIA